MNREIRKTSIVLTLLILGNLVFIGGYLFLNHTTGSLQIEAETISRAIALHRQREASIYILRNILRETEGDRAELDRFFVATEGVVSFLKHIEQLGRAAGLGVETSGLSETDLSAPMAVKKLTITLKFRGEWKELMQFVSLVDSLQNETHVTLLDATVGGEAQNKKAPPVWSGVLTTESFVRTSP